MAININIRNPQFEQLIKEEAATRGNWSLTGTLRELAEERLTEIANNAFIHPKRMGTPTTSVES